MKNINILIFFLALIAPVSCFAQACKDYDRRGRQFYEQKEYNKAVNEYTLAIKLCPDNYRFLYHRAKAYMKTGDLDNALFDLDLVFRFNSKESDFYALQGDIYYHKQEYKKALECIDKAIEIDPKNIYAYSKKGEVFLKTKMYDEAIENLSKAISLKPDNNGYCYLIRGYAYFAKEEFEKSRDDFQKAKLSGEVIPPNFTEKIDEYLESKQ